MVEVHECNLIKKGDKIPIDIPSNWEGAIDDKKALMILSDICIIMPESVANATGEYFVLKLLESMIDTGIIRPEDVQKAMEHIV
tara:strand:- start:1817 stop:2068 length:252 start_codon:yes stop_codon:yes gene_type:complete